MYIFTIQNRYFQKHPIIQRRFLIKMYVLALSNHSKRSALSIDGSITLQDSWGPVQFKIIALSMLKMDISCSFLIAFFLILHCINATCFQKENWKNVKHKVLYVLVFLLLFFPLQMYKFGVRSVERTSPLTHYYMNLSLYYQTLTFFVLQSM